MVAAEQANSEAALRFAWESGDIALGWQILSHAEDYRTEGSLTRWPSWVEQLRSTAEANPEVLPRRMEVRVLLFRDLIRVLHGEVAKSAILDDGIETVLQCEEPRFQYGLLARVGHTLPLAPQLDEASRRFNLELAERYLAAARSVSKEGPQPGRFHYSVLRGQAEVAWQLHGDHARSRRLYEEALALARSTNDALDAAFTLHGLGFLNLVDRRLLEAADQLHEAAAKYEEVGILQDWAGAEQQLVRAYLLLGRLDEAQAVARGLLGNPRVRPDVGLIRSLCRQVADLAVRRGMLSEAAIMLGASNAYEREDEVWGLFTPGSVVTDDEEPPAYAPWFYAEGFERLQQTRRSLGAEVFEKLTQEGASMGVDAAADLVLGKRGGREHGRDSARARRNPKLEG
jgi:tetratricopeptide (TPR) repeat protein